MIRMSAICPTARIQTLQDVGHFSVMENPSDFFKRVNTFITDNR